MQVGTGVQTEVRVRSHETMELRDAEMESLMLGFEKSLE